MAETLLIVGLNTRPIVQSAKEAGFKIVVVDYFRDLDLLSSSDKLYSILQPKPLKSLGAFCDSFDEGRLLKLAKRALAHNKIDFILVGTSIGESPAILKELKNFRPILVSNVERVSLAVNRENLLEAALKIGVEVPKTFVISSRKEATSKLSEEMQYPSVVKPVKGFGGLGTTKVNCAEEVEEAYLYAVRVSGQKRVLVQEYINGLSVSVPVISNGREALALAVGEQLLGLREYGQYEEFGYSGNVFPLDSNETVDGVLEAAQRIVKGLRLVGYNGVDMVVKEDGTPVLMEVNTRFQSLIECIEIGTGINMVKLHIESFINKKLPSFRPTFRCYVAKLVVFSKEKSLVGRLGEVPDVADITPEMVIVPQHEPICTVLATGKSRSEAIEKAEARASLIYEKLKPA